jgi:hypothetical protein
LVAAKETIEMLQQDQLARVDEITELDEMAAAILAELEEGKDGLGVAKNTISNFEISLGKLTAERDETETAISGIDAATSEQLKALTIERAVPSPTVTEDTSSSRGKRRQLPPSELEDISRGMT